MTDADILARPCSATLELGYPFVRRAGADPARLDRHRLVNQDVELEHIAADPRPPARRFPSARRRRARHHYRPGLLAAEPPWRLTGLSSSARASTYSARPRLRPGRRQLPRRRARCRRAGSRAIRRDRAALTAYGEFRPMPSSPSRSACAANMPWKPLLSFEEFSAGNYTVGRGYDPGALLGDSGFGTQAELRYGSRVPPAPAARDRRLCLLGPRLGRPLSGRSDHLHASGASEFGRRRLRAPIGTASCSMPVSRCRSPMSDRST